VDGTGVNYDGTVVNPTAGGYNSVARLMVTITNGTQAVCVTQRVVVWPLSQFNPADNLKITREAASGTVNLTNQGTKDWVLFNAGSNGNLTGVNRKSGVAASISNLVWNTNSGSGVSNDTNGATFAWSDGTSPASGTFNRTGIEIKGNGNSLSFTLPYSTGKQDVAVYVHGWGASATFKAEEISASGSTVGTPQTAPFTSNSASVFRFGYYLTTPGNHVKVTFTLDTGGDLKVAAITLSETPADISSTARLNLSREDQAGGNVVLSGKDWLLFNGAQFQDFERQNGGAAIKNIDIGSTTTSFSLSNPGFIGYSNYIYIDGTRVPVDAVSTPGTRFHGADAKLTFTAPYSSYIQRLSLYASAISSTAEFKAEAVKIDGGEVVGEAISQFGDPSGNSHMVFKLSYLLDPGQYLRVTFRTVQGDDIRIAAVMLDGYVEANVSPSVINGQIWLSPNSNYKGGEVNVFTAPRINFAMVDGSLKYTTASGVTVPIANNTFTMPGEDVVVSAEFERIAPDLNTSFYSSFETGQEPLRHATVDFDGVMGKGAGMPRLPGDMMRMIENMEGSGPLDGNEGMRRLYDNDPNTKWCQTNAVWGSEVYALYIFDKAYVAKTYLISSANDDFPNNRSRSLYSWRVQGSNDKTNWTTLDTQTAQQWTANFQDRVYTFENNTAYRYYKLIVDAIYGNGTGQRTGTVQASDWSLGTGEGPPIVPEGELPPASMASFTHSPNIRWNGRSSAGLTGTRALAVAGEHTKDGRVFAKNAIYNFEDGEEISVFPTTLLSYALAPSFTPLWNQANPEYPNYPAQHIAVDLLLTDPDGSNPVYLSELPCYDSHGVKVDPQSQFEGRVLYEGQWNKITANIGDVAAGKVIRQILVSYDNKNGAKGTSFEAFLDDVRIVEKRSDDPSVQDFSEAFDSSGNIAHPSVLTEARRGTMSSTAMSRGLLTTNINMPFSFNFWGPQTNGSNANTDLYTWLSHGNSQNRPALRSFSINHQPSLWIADRGNFNIMASRESNVNTNATRDSRNYTFTHDNEVAHNYYYKVTLDNGMVGELAPTDHAAAIRWTFPSGTANKHMLFDSHATTDGTALGRAEVTWVTNGSVLEGAWFRTDHKAHDNGQRRMYVYVKFDKPATAWGTTVNTTSNLVHYVSFGPGEGVVTTYAASSYISWQQARNNLDLEIGTKDFDQVKTAGQKVWDDMFKTVQVLDFAPDGWDGNVDTLPLKTLDELVTLYSNMHRSYSWPNALHENTGTNEAPVYRHASQYQGTTSAPTIVDGVMYINNGFWDTYKSAWQAYGELIPNKAGELLNGLVNHYIYNNTGFIPRWIAPGGHPSMCGSSSDVIFGTAASRGVKFDIRRAYESALRASSVLSGDLKQGGRQSLNTSLFNGYAPNTNISWGLEGCINDFGTAVMADKLGYNEEAVYLTSRALNYVQYWNTYEVTDVFSGETIPGGWLRSKANPDSTTGVINWSIRDQDFNPYSWGHGYEETNAWNMSFTLVDGMGMQNLLGGPEGMEKRLDGIFDNTQNFYQGTYSFGGGPIHEQFEAAACKMGQYNHGNQPSHQLPFYYNFTGSPWKTQHYTRDIMDRLYTGWEIGQGYAGDEDNGELSSWYVLTALGLSPTALGWDEFYLTAPYFSHVKVERDNGTIWEIKAPGVSNKNRYIQSLKINGVPYDKTYVTQEILNGSGNVLFEFVMGDKPSNWGTGEYSAPPSLTAPGVDPQPLTDLTKGYTNRGGEEILISSGAGGTAANLFNNHAGDPNSTANKFVSTTFNAANGMFFGYKFNEPQVVHMYTISVGDTAARNPRSWVFEASNDGTTWDTLDTRTNVRFGDGTKALGPAGTPVTDEQVESSGANWTCYTKPFGIINSKAYTQYRIRVTAIGSGSTIEIAELEFLGYKNPDTAYTAFKGDFGPGCLNVINGKATEIEFLLPRKPLKPVTVTLDSAELGINNKTFTFTPENWYIGQKLAVNPVVSRRDATGTLSVKSSSLDYTYNSDIVIPATITGDFTFWTEYSHPGIVYAEGGDMEITVTARNNHTTDDHVNIIAALYDPEGLLYAVDRSALPVPAVGEKASATVKLPVPVDSEGYEMRVFYWDYRYIPLLEQAITLWAPIPPDPPENVALNKPVRAVPGYQNEHAPERVNDGRMDSRWAPNGPANNEWIIIDLLEEHEIYYYNIYWEASASRDYYIEISSANKTLANLVDSDFTVAYRNSNGQGGFESYTFNPTVKARFVRMRSVARTNSSWGASIFEFEIFGWPLTP
jgi:predicted alpha-1,2-mannosidase